MSNSDDIVRGVSGPPETPPIGLRLTRTGRDVAQAFERAMAAAGGTPARWQVLLVVRSGRGAQSEIAKAIGVTPATLTHHLRALERDGLVRRWREDGNRRVQRTELTPEGEELFLRLRDVAVEHSARIRAALGDDAARFAEMLDRVSDQMRATDS